MEDIKKKIKEMEQIIAHLHVLEEENKRLQQENEFLHERLRHSEYERFKNEITTNL